MSILQLLRSKQPEQHEKLIRICSTEHPYSVSSPYDENISNNSSFLKQAQQVSQSKSITTKTAGNIFDKQLTEDEQQLIKSKTAKIREYFLKHAARQLADKIKSVQTVYPWIEASEVEFSLNQNEKSVESTIEFFADPENLAECRKQLALEAMKHPAENHLALSRVNRMQPKFQFRRHNKEKRRRIPRLVLDQALAKQGTKCGWSEARVSAFAKRTTNPNAYYYRFNQPGEPQATGKWTVQEHEMFIRRLKEVGAYCGWGVFSIPISGRVGYQCSNYYRYLITEGRIKDPNYILDTETGKLRFLFKKYKADDGTVLPLERKTHIANATAPSFSLKTLSSPSSPKKSTGHNKKRTKKKKKKKRARYSDLKDENNIDWEDPYNWLSEDSDNYLDDVEYKPSRSRSRSKPSGERPSDDVVPFGKKHRPLRSKPQKNVKPQETLEAIHVFGSPNSKNTSAFHSYEELLKATCPISLEQMEEPAISPYGHVMDYNSWSKQLQERGYCPYTRNPLKRREIVKLTVDNFFEYQDRLILSNVFN